MQYGHNTKTLVWNLADLEKPEHVFDYFHSTKSIDHNMYVKGHYLYQSNYMAGLRILDISKVADGTLTEAGCFDTMPNIDKAEFDGAWSIFPFYASGTVVISNIDGRLFIVKPNLP